MFMRLESRDPCNLYFMANLRVYVRWLMVTFLSPSIRHRLHAQHTKLWNIDLLYLKSYSGLALTKVPEPNFHSTRQNENVLDTQNHWSGPAFCFSALIQTSPQLKQKQKEHVFNCQSKGMGDGWVFRVFFFLSLYCVGWVSFRILKGKYENWPIKILFLKGNSEKDTICWRKQSARHMRY